MEQIPRFGKKTALMVAVGLLAVIFCFSSHVEAARKFTIRVAAQKRTLDYVLAGKDWGKKYGIEMKIQHFASSKGPITALVAGKADVGLVAPSRLMPIASRQKGRWVIFGNTYYGSKRHSLSVAKDSPYKKLEDLKGKRLAARVGSGNYETFLRVIAARGWNVKDFKIVNMKPGDMPPALKQGLVDGFLVWEPTPAASEVKGISRILMNFDGWAVVPNYLTTSKKYLDKNRETVVHFLAAWMDAASLMKEKPHQAAKIATAYQKRKIGVEVPEKVHELTLQRAHYMTRIGPKEAKFFREDWVKSGKSWLKRRKVKSVPDFDSLLDLKVQEDAEKLRGK